MKCEICHKSEAETVLHKNVGGTEREFYVCRDCARNEERARKTSSRRSGRKPRSGVSVTISALPEHLVPQPVLDALVNATAGLVEEIGRAGEGAGPELRCKACGYTWEEYDKTGLLGCPACYHAFRDKLAPRIRTMHLASEHVCARTDGAGTDAMRETMKKRIADAVKRQDFELAGRLRDELSAMEKRRGGNGADRPGGGKAGGK